MNLKLIAGAATMLAMSVSLVAQASPQQVPYLHAPAVDAYATFNPRGTTVLPTGRLIKPWGVSTPLAQWPHAMVLSPDGKTAFVASGSVGQLIEDWNSPHPTVKLVEPMRQGVGGSAAFSPDGKKLYWSGGNNGGFYEFDVATAQEVGFVSIDAMVDGTKYANSVIQSLRVSPGGHYLYCADVANFRIAIVDLETKKVVGSAPTGYYPYALAISGKHIFVANIGMFRYHVVPAAPVGYPQRGISHPPFGTPSQQALTGVNMEGRHIVPVGKPNSAGSFSVWDINVTNPQKPVVEHVIKTGVPVGAHSAVGVTVGGSAPNFLVVRGNTLFVSDNNDDLIEQFNATTGRIIRRTLIQPSPLVANLRGVQPAGLALSPNGKRLYICEIGINAIGIMDTQTGRILGHIPTAWYPYRVIVSPNGGHLGVICFRGFGNGPNAGPHQPVSPFLGMKGVFTRIPLPTNHSELGRLTAQVLYNNGMVDRSADRAEMSSPVIPTTPGDISPDIKYVVFILKENHTFDTVFDHVPGARSDSSLLRWGLHQDISAPGEPTLHNVPVMTNHNALARDFTVSDNFYMMPEMSGVGHRWLVDVKPNNWCQMVYTLGWDFRPVDSSPGRLVPFGSDASMAPEDYPEAGSVWDHLTRYHKTFRNYGEGFEFSGIIEDDKEVPTGARETVNIPMEKCLYDNTCFGFPIFNMNIPDQYRADWFEKDFTQRFIDGTRPMPSFTCIDLCNDHGTGPQPKRGYPYVASWMADDDLALGRIVDFLSHTKYWKHMAIFVTEDDSGGEPDHVDAQRSVLLLISPWAKRHYVSHRHTTIVSMHKTMYEIFGLPPLSYPDAVCNDFSDCFTTHPDFAPYTTVPVDPQIFDPKKALLPGQPGYQSASRALSFECDDPIIEKYVLNNPGSIPAR